MAIIDVKLCDLATADNFANLYFLRRYEVSTPVKLSRVESIKVRVK